MTANTSPNNLLAPQVKILGSITAIYCRLLPSTAVLLKCYLRTASNTAVIWDINVDNRVILKWYGNFTITFESQVMLLVNYY